MLFSKVMRFLFLSLTLLSLFIKYHLVEANVDSNELEEKYDLYSMKATDSNDYCLGLLQELDTLLPTYFPSNPMTIVNFPPKNHGHLPWLNVWRKWILYLRRVKQIQEKFTFVSLNSKDLIWIIDNFNDLIILTKMESIQKEFNETHRHNRACLEPGPNACPLYIRNLETLLFRFNETCPDLFRFQQSIFQAFQEKYQFPLLKLQPVTIKFYIYQTILKQIQEFHETQEKEKQRFMQQSWFSSEPLRLNPLTDLLRDIQENFQILEEPSKRALTNHVQVNEFLTQCTNMLKTKLKQSLVEGYKQVNEFQWIAFEGKGYLSPYCFEQCVPLVCDETILKLKPCNLEQYIYLYSGPFYTPS